MPQKPKTAAGYHPDQVELVKATVLYVATKLGDLLDQVTVVGGLVPSLLIPQEPLPANQRHAGTLDLDVGLSLGVLDGQRYQAIAARLREAGFAPDVNENNMPTRQRWRFENQGKPAATVDFLIGPTPQQNEPGRLFNLEPDLAAIITPGLPLAFRDRDTITLHGRTILGERATRKIGVCGAGAFIILKALAFQSRGENKDAYDLHYMLGNHSAGMPDIVQRIHSLKGEPEVEKALDVLAQDFSDHDGVGPRRVADFISGEPDDEVQADVVGFVTRFLELCRVGKG